MSMQSNSPKRGRPQSLDRDTVLEIALRCYWTDGPTRVAISHICQDANVSKPSLYREFGNDDGLKEAALNLYRERALAPFYDILTTDLGFSRQIEALITFTIQDRKPLGIPSGCLQVAMRAHKDDLGPKSQRKVEALRQETLTRYENWIDQAKANGECKVEISSKAAALFCDAQNGGAMRMQREGVASDVIAQTMRLAFSSFV